MVGVLPLSLRLSNSAEVSTMESFNSIHWAGGSRWVIYRSTEGKAMKNGQFFFELWTAPSPCLYSPSCFTINHMNGMRHLAKMDEHGTYAAVNIWENKFINMSFSPLNGQYGKEKWKKLPLCFDREEMVHIFMVPLFSWWCQSRM